MKKSEYLVFALVILAAVILSEPASAHHEAGVADSHDSHRSFMREAERIEQEIARRTDQFGGYSMHLYEPIKELGQLQQQSGYHQAAIDSFRRNQHLVHRRYGVHSAVQIESLDLLMASYIALGDFLAVDTQQRFRFDVADRAFSPDDRAHISARLKLADWYRQTSRFKDALALYESSMALIPSTDAGARVRVLRSIAMTQYLAGWCCATTLLQEALALMEGIQDEMPFEVTQSITDLMDMAALEKRARSDVQMPGVDSRYLGFARRQDILRLMNPARLEFGPRATTYVDFGAREPDAPPVPTVGYPVAMCGTTYDRLVSRSSRGLLLDVTLTVSDDGRPADIEISGDVPHRLKHHLREALKIARYRAATNEVGESVDAKLTFTQHFDASEVAVSSRNQVDDWGRMLVAQTCQVQGVQRI